MSRTYIERMCFNAPNECLKFFSRHHSLIENLNRVFSNLCYIFTRLYGYKYCSHIFINPDFQEIHCLSTYDKIHHVLPNEEAAIPYIIHAYKMKKLGNMFKPLLDALNFYEINEDYPSQKVLSEDKMNEILSIIEINTERKYSGILIPFNYADLKLGFFLLWDYEKEKGRISIDSHKNKGWLTSLYDILCTWFIREFEIKDIQKTYLPSLYASRWKKAAILFAKINNFSLLERRIRQKYASGDEIGLIRGILNQHCTEMSNIISANQGRIEHFFGSGLMAIFGEHNESYCEAAVKAVASALEMIERFNELKPNFLRKIIGEDYEIEYNEHPDIRFSVGVDFGTVLFEYLGGDEHQKFTVIGDHVDMAEFLMMEAGSSAELVYQRENLLISPTVDRLTLPWIDTMKKQSATVYNGNIGRSVTAYGISKDSFKRESFNRCKMDSSGDSWNDVWNTTGYNKPY